MRGCIYERHSIPCVGRESAGLCRDQTGNSFSAIAKECGISAIRTVQLYDRMKMRQIRLYSRHISIAPRYESTAKIGREYLAAYDFYQGLPYACAYLEKTYRDILEAYRAGEPGMPRPFLDALPPLRQGLTQEEVSRVVEMRETEKAPYAAIAKELSITPEMARYTYDLFYHRQILAHVQTLQKDAKGTEEREAIWLRYFGGNLSPKRRYDRMLAERDGTQPQSQK